MAGHSSSPLAQASAGTEIALVRRRWRATQARGDNAFAGRVLQLTGRRLLPLRRLSSTACLADRARAAAASQAFFALSPGMNQQERQAKHDAHARACLLEAWRGSMRPLCLSRLFPMHPHTAHVLPPSCLPAPHDQRTTTWKEKGRRKRREEGRRKEGRRRKKEGKEAPSSICAFEQLHHLCHYCHLPTT